MIQYSLVVVIIILSSNVVIIKSDLDFNYCQIGAPGKCLGDTMNMLELGTPMPDAGLIQEKNETTYESCSDLCIRHIDCFMASFLTSTSYCHLYRKISYRHSTSPITKLFLWNCCNENFSYNAPNRCPGFWRFMPQSITDNKIRTLDPLLEYKGVTLYQCQMSCLNNTICGAINYLTRDKIDPLSVNCQLIIQFPVDHLMLIAMDNWTTYQWQCSGTFILPTPSSECTQRLNHNPGYWVIENRSVQFNSTMNNMIYFFTLDHQQCLRNCELYPECKTAWYSLESYDCILTGDNTTTCGDSTPDKAYQFTTYVWKNCDPNQQPPEEQKVYTNSCRTLVDNKYTYIYPISCGHLPSDISDLSPCWNNPIVSRGTLFSNNILCQTNHSYRVFDQYKPTYATFNRFANVTWLRVYTGYDSFWLVNVSDTNFPTATNQDCEIFDSSFYTLDKQPLKIVKREEWFPSKSRKPENLFSKKPVNYVIISDTEVPFCNCYSIEACSSIMRRIQQALLPFFFSIPYSFIITGDGVAYEARGWDLEPAVGAGKYNPDSFVIALCGQYHKSPSVTSLSAVKKLIQIAIERGKVAPNYVLYIYNDIRDRPYPFDGLRRVIELWPHYGGNIKGECHTIKTVTLVSHLVAVVCCGLIIAVCIHVFHFRIWHQPECNVVKKCRIETMYSNMFQKSVEILPQILMHNIDILRFEDRSISPLTSPVIWIEDSNTICDVRYQKTENCQCKSALFGYLDLCRFQGQLVNVSSLASLQEIRSCSRSIVFVFQRHAELGNGYFLILHFRQIKSVNRFINRLHQNRCVCDSFVLSKYSTSSFCFGDIDNFTEVQKTVDRIHLQDDMEKKYSVLIRAYENTY